MDTDLTKRILSESRRAIRVSEPGVQLRLPLTIICLTLVFVTAFALNSHAAYQRIVELTLAQAEHELRGNVVEQTGAFLVVSGAILGGYLLAILGICLAHTHRLLGPRVALRRQIAALRRGDFGARVHLRRSDMVFREVAKDLNDLAQTLERTAERPLPPPGQLSEALQ